MSRFLPARLRGLKGRLALVVALVLLVPTAFAIAQAMKVKEEDEARQRATLERTLTLIAGYHDQAVEQATRLLSNLATRPDVTGDDMTLCRQALEIEAQQNALFRAFARTDATGRAICSSSASAVGLDFSDRDWFLDLARNGKDIVSSGVLMSRNPLTGRTIVLGVPLRDGQGQFAGAIGLALALDGLIALPQSIQLPADAIAAVVDQDGTIVTSRGQLGLVDIEPQTIRNLLSHPFTQVVAESHQGTTWQFMSRPSEVEGVLTAVVVGLPVQRWNWLDARFQSGILLPTSILFLSVFVVWVATDLLITRPLLKLARAVRKWRRDGEIPNLALDGAPEELEELAHAFTRAAREIRERDQLLQSSLQEKDLLLREIHHRVKNNLQIVTSLLNLRAASLRNVQAQRAMREAQLGIKALALVHRKLYERIDLKLVSLDELLEELCPLVHDLSTDLSNRVSLAISLDPMVVVADQATPLALLTTELLTNAAKHAFPEARRGTIEVRLERLEGGMAQLVIADDGIGIATEAGAESTEVATGMGAKLVQMFARQVGGQLHVETGNSGTRTTLVFTPLTK
ncbi:MAG TPA: histidine kinase dimerization/phosphoacceptor domain -containing protein [Geminicoccus sp.]|uniref:sensor histidine kinase n=1 Tax=Geminicoccus sp. TaxID=2024832 RepID=UPI002E318A30|nr:histidine kinase dimerization/phosphoacceptor domain -containing protein [Geminicoccus sp.]HEX2527893.1 histidine kinase dimerization/phosphoacceptor domain -containing protein [Geminicoccus sp.]